MRCSRRGKERKEDGWGTEKRGRRVKNREGDKERSGWNLEEEREGQGRRQKKRKGIR